MRYYLTFLATLGTAAGISACCGPKATEAQSTTPDFMDRAATFGLLDEMEAAQEYQVGAGIGDITGPAAGLATAGYAAPALKTTGIHQRLWSRAFVIAQRNADDSSPDGRVALVTADLCYVTGAVKTAVIDALRAQFGDRYGHRNVLVAATHTHSGPAGFGHHGMYNVPTKGFSEENFRIIVQGIVKSIVEADARQRPAAIRMTTGSLHGASRNRSLRAFERNDPTLRAELPNAVDETVTMLRMDEESGEPIGLLHWFATHATSVNKYNSLITGDNKGYAAWKFERQMGADQRNRNAFVAAFANSNAGDASPNVAADVDGDGDWECEANDNFLCMKAIGELHYDSALQLYQRGGSSLTGAVRAGPRFVDMSRITLTDPDDEDEVTTCPAAIGLSMLAGSAEDGPGVGVEGVSCSDGNLLANGLCRRPRGDCHGNKPIVLQTGTLGSQGWTPQVLPVQIITVGPLAIAGVPAEMTSMAGFLLRRTLLDELAPHGIERVVIAAYANEYSNYVTTREEYQAQHYEGASTLFGEWTLAAYQKTFSELALAVVSDADIDQGEIPQTSSASLRAAEQERGLDSAPRDSAYGAVITDVADTYQRGQVAAAVFQGSNPNHDMQTGKSFLEVQRANNAEWQTVAYDWDFETKFIWQMDRGRRSTFRVEWQIPETAEPGTYRLKIRGKALESRGNERPYQGWSSSFQVH